MFHPGPERITSTKGMTMANILIVDDSSILRAILRAALEHMGHQVVGEATSGDEALVMYKELRPDLVTLDIMMSTGNGLDYLAKLIELDALARVVMVTALSQEQLKQQAFEAGATGFVKKPFDIDLLRHQIDVALAAPVRGAHGTQERTPCQHE